MNRGVEVRKRSNRRRSAFPALCTTLLLALFAGIGSASAVPGVEPPSVTATLNPGQSLVVTKTVHTPSIPPKPDIVFLADTTSSMSGAIANVQAQAGAVMTQVIGVQALAQFGVAHYTDQNCPNPYTLDLGITANTAAVQTALNSLTTPNLGCNADAPEDWLNALFHVATDASVGFRADSTRIVVLFGDSTSHDPSVGHTEAQVTAALVAAGIKLVAVPVPGTPGFAFNGLDTTGQASRIAAATGGVVIPAATAGDVATAILQGLQNLPVTVAPLAICDPGLTASYDAPSKTIVSGGDVTFAETLTVAAANPGGVTLHCSVDFLLNGLSGGTAFHQTVSITVNGADLAVVKTGPALVTEGQNLTYHLVATNNGPAAATGVVVKDTLPANSTFVSASAGCVHAAGIVTCTVGSLASGASTSFDIIVTAGSSGTTLTNTATISGNQSDPILANNTSTVITTLNRNPICTGVTAGPDLWPPNHKLRLISLTGATDPDGTPLTTAVTGVTQDEPLNGLGDGNTSPDAFHGPMSNQVYLRAERSGLADGRVYRISFLATDTQGGSCTGTALVGVPHDQGAHATAIDSGGIFVDF
jgi:uncharacterized repeat protein (TIGR01451 family)